MKQWQIGWGTIPTCNLNCEFCYSKNVRLKNEDVTVYQDWVNFVDQNHEYISTINYGTGENTLSLDWFYLIGYIRDHYPKIKQALTTNGYLAEQITKHQFCYDIAVNSLDEIDVSLDFADKDRYCQFRGNYNVYQWALNALEFCQKINIDATIVFIGGKPILEKSNIDGLFKIAKRYGAKLRMNIYRPTNPDQRINDRFISSYQQILDILYHINDNYHILSISDPLFSSILTDGHFESDPSGVTSVRILHNGNITPSTYLISNNFQLCNINEYKVFEKIEREQIFSNLNLNVVPEECKYCELKKVCKGGVYDRRYLWYKTFDKKDPYCPFNEGHFLPKRKLTISTELNFSSIHHGYLPTMFFTN